MIAKLVVVLLLLVVLGEARATSYCDGRTDGEVCPLPGGTQGTCTGGACTRTFTVPAGEARTGTGTISSSGGTVTGSGTVFTSELQVGDTLIAGGQRVAVAAITSDTSLTTDPGYGPPISATSFQFANPIMTFLDENGVVRGLINPRGLVAYGQPYASGSLTIIGPTETSPGVSGKDGRLKTGQGAPADAGNIGGGGGSWAVQGGAGGATSFAGQSPGQGGDVIAVGGFGGASTVGIGGNAGGAAILGGDAGTSASGFAGSPGGGASVVGGAGSSTSGGGANGNGGIARLTGGTHGTGGVGGSTGDTLICDNGGTVKLGTTSQTQLNCATGGFTKIRGVTVSAFPPTNAVGVMKNDGGGNYSLAAVAGTDFATQTANTVFAGPSSGSAATPTFRAVVMVDLPAALGAFVQANAGGL